MTTPLDHSTRYDLMSTDQASPPEIAAWLKEPGFAAYVEARRGTTPKPAPSLPSQEDVARELHRTSHPNANWDLDRPECQERMREAAAILALMSQSGDGWQDIASAPEEDGFYWVYQKVPPQSHPMQAARYKKYSGWLSSWPVLAWRKLPAPPAKEGR